MQTQQNHIFLKHGETRRLKAARRFLTAAVLSGAALSSALAADLEATLHPGGSVAAPMTAIMKDLPLTADVLFSFDCTGSMGDILSTAQARALEIMRTLEATGVRFRYGVASYMDYPDSYSSCGYSEQYGDASAGDYAYRLNLQLTTDTNAVAAAVGSLFIGSGWDGPQDYTRVLYESYADPNIRWSTGARRILLNFGDNVPHDCNLNLGVPGTSGVYSTGGDPGRDGIMGTVDDLVLRTVLEAMRAQNVTLLEAHSADWDTSDGVSVLQYWDNWTAVTGGKVFLTTSDTVVVDMVREITNALTVTCVNNLHVAASPALYNSWLSSSPASYATVCSGETNRFDVTITVPPGTSGGDYAFTLSVVDDRTVSYVNRSVLFHVAGGARTDLVKRNLSPGTNAFVGDVFDYEINFNTYSNAVAAESLKLVDYLPPELDFVSATANGAVNVLYETDTRRVVWDFGTWPPLAAGPTNHVTVRLNSDAAPGALIDNLVLLVCSNLPPIIARDPAPRRSSGGACLTVGPSLVETNTLRVWQTGLFYQTVGVTNSCGTTAAAFLLWIDGLSTDCQVYNASGVSNGIPYLLYNVPLPAGQGMEFAVEYYVPGRSAVPVPVLSAQAVTPPTPITPAGDRLDVTRALFTNGCFLVEFRSISNRIYSIQYSTNMTDWQTALPPVIGTGTAIIWLDSGPPKTDSLPTAVANRFYRILQTP